MKQSKVSKSDAHYSQDKLAVCGIVENVSHIAWNGNDWAYGCEFWENDLDNVTTSSHDCNHRCVSTKGMQILLAIVLESIHRPFE